MTNFESLILTVLEEHRINWKPGSWRCACGDRAWTTDKHFNGHIAEKIARKIGAEPVTEWNWNDPKNGGRPLYMVRGLEESRG